MDVHEPGPFDLDEERRTRPLTAHEQCESDWMRDHGKTVETMTADDLAAVRIACPVYGKPGEHSER